MRFSILHFSDLHQDTHNEIDSTSLVESLVRDFNKLESSNPPIVSPSLCVVSGDLVYGAKPGLHEFDNELTRQYSNTLDVLTQITDAFFNGDRQKVVIIPGNHDVCANSYLQSTVRIDAPVNERERELLVTEYFRPRSKLRWSWRELCFYRINNDALYANRLDAFRRFYEQFYQGSRTYSNETSEQVDFFEYPELKLLIVGLSSCHDNDIHNRTGTIHPKCVSEALRQIRNPRYSGWLKGATWHHSLFGLPKQDDYLDAEPLQLLIDAGISFGLNGHQHRSSYLDEYLRVSERNRKISVFSASTLCAGPSQLTPGEPRGYNIIEIDTDSWQGTLHQRRMINHQFDLPLWGPGHFVESNASYLPFSLSPPLGPYNGTQTTQANIELAEDLIRQRKWQEAKAILVQQDDDLMSRRLLSEVVENTNDVQLAIAKLFPPTSLREAIIVGGAILETGDRELALAFCNDKFVRNSKDPSINEVVTRVQRKLIK
jgi:hypothetical protein